MSLYTKLVAEVDQYEHDMQGAYKATTLVRDGMVSMSKVAAGAVVAGVTAATVALGIAINKTVEWGEELDSIGDVLGTSSEESAGLNVMFKEVGGSTEQLTGAMQIMTRGILDAKGGLGPTGLAMQKLGINALDAAGNIKPSTQLFQEIADKLGPMKEGLERSQYEMDIFGRSGAQMGDALAVAANGGMAQYMQKAKDMGLAFTGEQTDSIVQFGRSLKDLEMMAQGLASTIGIQMMPALTELVKGLQEKLATPEMQNRIKELAESLGKFALDAAPKLIDLATAIIDLVIWLTRVPEPVYKMIGVLTAVVIAAGPVFTLLTNLTGLFTGLSAALGISTAAGTTMGGVLAFLTGPVGWLVLAVIALIATIVLFGKQAWQTMSDVSAIFRTVVGNIIENNIRVFVNAIGWIVQAVKDVITWIGNLGAAFARLTIPAWLTPGSPTPLEVGVRGISAAMQDASNQVLPQFQAQLNLNARNPAPAAQPAPIVQQQQAAEIDYARLGRAVRDALMTSGMAA